MKVPGWGLEKFCYAVDFRKQCKALVDEIYTKPATTKSKAANSDGTACCANNEILAAIFHLILHRLGDLPKPVCDTCFEESPVAIMLSNCFHQHK